MLHKNLAIISFFCLPVLGCAQTTSDKPDWSNLYNCEGCEAIYEGMASGWSIKIASDDEPGDRLRINGVVFQSDGKTPAPDVSFIFIILTKKEFIRYAEMKRVGVKGMDI